MALSFLIYIHNIIEVPLTTQFNNGNRIWRTLVNEASLRYIDAFTVYNTLHSYYNSLSNKTKELLVKAYTLLYEGNRKNNYGNFLEHLSLKEPDLYFYYLVFNVIGSIENSFGCLQYAIDKKDVDEENDLIEWLGPLFTFYDRSTHDEQGLIIDLCASKYRRDNYSTICNRYILGKYPTVDALFKHYNIPASLSFDKVL